jgi:alkylation response protein AidB-like acyl-CoA dehydrogenase
VNLDLTEDQILLTDTFRRFFDAESTIARVRAAEPAGFDPALWISLAQMGAIGLRLPTDDGLGTFEAALLMAEAGRTLASVPLAEAMVAVRLLALFGGQDDLVARTIAGEAIVTLALREAGDAPLPVPAGAVADAVLFLDGDTVRLATIVPRVAAVDTHGSTPVAALRLKGEGALPSIALAAGAEARAVYLAAVEEWSLLTAAALAAMGRRALENAADYAKERKQFGRSIASFQAVAHPLADAIADVTGAEMMVWWTIDQVSRRTDAASGAIALCWWWAAQASGAAVARALHTYGGYGLTVEYDAQLFHRRAKATALVFGDPRDSLVAAGARLWRGAVAPLPDVGAVALDFSMGPAAEAFAAETRAFLDRALTPEWRAKAHYSYDGHDWPLNRAMGAAGLLFPLWGEAEGGRGLDDFAAAAGLEVWDDEGVTSHAQAVSNMVGQVITRFGSDELKAAIVPGLAAGEIISCLGYSEPSSGSDIFAAETRAVRDGDDWIVNGQKMFTSGANLAHHVLLLTRTDPDAPKHRGITLFVVPLDDPGIEIHPVHTFQEERTNATFYTDVRVPDSYRIGPVHGALDILSWALSLEQGGGGFVGPHRHVIEAAVEWAREAPRGQGMAIDDDRVIERLAAAAARSRVSYLLFWRTLWLKHKGVADRAAGPMSKLFASESFLRDAGDLFDLAAPDTLLRGRHALGRIELAARHAAGTTIYGGTSEVQRSQVAEASFGLPKSR